MPQRYHKQPRCGNQGLKLSPRHIDRYQNTGATMLSKNKSTLHLDEKYKVTTSQTEDVS